MRQTPSRATSPGGTWARPARWITASTRSPRQDQSTIRERSSGCGNTPGGAACRHTCPVTDHPADNRARQTAAPTKPLAPVTKAVFIGKQGERGGRLESLIEWLEQENE